MKHRNPLAVVGLSIITLGIYDLYWLVKTKTELNAKTQQKIPTIWILVLPIIVLIVGYVLLIAGVGHTANTLNTYGTSYSATSTTTSTYTTPSANGGNTGLFVVGLIIVIIGWLLTLLASIIWFFKFSKAVNEYTAGKMSTAVTFLVLWLIHLIGVALIQDAFNDMGGASRPQPVAAGAVAAPQAPSEQSENHPDKPA